MKDKISLRNAVANIKCATYVWASVTCGSDRQLIRVTKVEAVRFLEHVIVKCKGSVGFRPITDRRPSVVIGGWAKREIVL